jgi:uncharacterized protein YjiS (DUF1127 family)
MDGMLTKQELALLESRSPVFPRAALAVPPARAPGLRGWARQVSARFADWAERRFAAAELNRLNDREMADLGLMHGKIGCIARL